MTPDELCQLLSQLMQPDTKIVAEATAALKAYFKQVEAMENLLILMSQNADQQVRQISCVYLRKIAGKLWPNLTDDQKATTKVLLLQRFQEEPVTIVKKNIADVIGALAVILIPNKEWNELFQFIFKSTSSELLAEKELAMILLSVIIEYFTHEEIQQYYDGLNPIIEAYLQSEEPSLKTLSIETVNKLACTTKAVQVLKKYNNLIPLVTDALDMNNEDLILKVFETFNEFVDIQKVLGPHLPKIVEKALIISVNSDYSLNVREVTLLFLELIAEKYARILIKNQGAAFLSKIIEEGFKIASEDPELVIVPEDRDSPATMAIQMIFAYACHAPNEKIYPIIKEYLQKYSASANEHERAAAVYILGFIADSDACLDLIREDIGPMTDFLVNQMQDNSFVVREAAGEAVGRFAENVGEDFLEKHNQIMPCLLKVMKDLLTSNKESTIQKTLCALNELVKSLMYDLKLYLDDTIRLLLEYVKAPQFSTEVKYWTMYALSSTIMESEKKILPYMEELCEVCNAIITNQGFNFAEQVKGEALMCVGRLAAACGKDKFPMQVLEAFTQYGLKCLSNENEKQFQLRDTAISYFSDLSILLREEMAPIFDQVITEIMKTCNADDEIIEEKEKENPEAAIVDSDEDEEVEVAVDVNHLDEKAQAVNAIGVIGQHCPKLCQGRAQEILKTIEDIQFYFEPNIRLQAIQAYVQLTIGLLSLAGALDKDENFNWTKGSPQNSPLPPEAQQFLNSTVFPYYIKILEQDDDKEVIEACLQRITEVCNHLGPAAVFENLDKLVALIIKFLDKKAFCQTNMMEGEDEDDLEDVEDDDDDDDGEEEVGDDAIDHDERILGNVTEVIIALARDFGNDFAPYFAQIAPHLVVYTNDNHPKSDRNMALGALAETFAAAEAVLPNYFNDYVVLLEKNSDTQDNKLNRNVSYSIGVLAEKAQVLCQPHVQSFLTLLQKMHANTTEAAAQDNIIAATCRIVEFQLMPLPAEQRPVEYPALVDSVMEKMPLQGDDAENETMLKFAAKLYEQDQATCLKYMDKIALTCVKVLVDDKAADAIPTKFQYQVGQMITQMVAPHAQATLQELEAKMSEHEKEQLKKYMTAQ